MPNTINHDAWIKTRELTVNLDDQRTIRHNIEEALKAKMRYNKQVVSRDKLMFLKNNRIGTTRIENLAKQIEHGHNRNVNTVLYIIDNNIKRVVKDMKQLRNAIFVNDKHIKHQLGSEWRRQLYKDLCYSVITPLWKSEKDKSQRSKDYLINKYKHKTSGKVVVEQGDIRVTIAPSLTEEQRNRFISEQDDPVSMGIQLDENEKAFLKLPQSLTNHSSFNKTKMLTDVALMGSKIRMTVKSRIDEGLTEEEVNDRSSEDKRSDAIETAVQTRVYDPQSKVASFSNMRVTSMRTCRRVKIPDPLPEKEEAAIQSVITAVEIAINGEEQRNSKLKSSVSTLTKQEALGLKSLKKRTKAGEAAIVATDKSGRLAVMSKEHYNRKVSEHTGEDPVVSEEDVIQLEQVLSCTSSSMARVMCIGDTWNQQDRVQSAVKATHTNVPPLAILLKDHKPGEDKPVRPLCRSTESPNGPLSQLTAKVMNIVAAELNTVNRTEVKSTEEMCSVLDSVNDNIQENLFCLQQCGTIEQGDLAKHMMKEHPDHIPALTVGSMDVKALYPSLDIDHSCEIIKQLIVQSQVKFEVNSTELALHLAATHTQDELDKLGLSDIVHRRRYKYGPRPIIISKCVTGTKQEREGSDSWIHPERGPTQEEEKLMFAIAISQSVKLVMRSNVYQNSDVMRLQMLGMAIGSAATAEVAKLVMLEHDRILWQNCEQAGLVKLASGRYVDDENPVMKPSPYGARLVDDKIVIVDEHIQSDKGIPHDRRTFNLVQQIANKIWKNIQFTVDVPSGCPSGLIPMLDMEVGVSQTGHIIRRFYSKPMNTPFTILSRSAHSWSIKRSTLIQEGVRRLLNTSRDAPPHIKSSILSEWDSKMNVSGYDQTFRTNAIQSAVMIYTHKVETEQSGGRPLYRPSGWQADQRNMEKLVKRQTWYTGNAKQRNLAPLIIDPTPSGQLEKEIAQIMKEAARLTGIRVKVCQRGGIKVSSAAHADPFASKLCNRSECPVCRSPDSKGGCRHGNVGYQLVCKTCSDNGVSATYEGETSKSAYERGLQHCEGIAKKVEDAPMWRHSQLVHDSDPEIPFSMNVTGRFQKAMVRQEEEAIRIRESQSVHQLNSRKEFHQPTIIRLIPVSNLQQSDQSGSNNTPVIMYPSTKRKATSRADSPSAQPRSRPRYMGPHMDHKQASSSLFNFQVVTTTRRERQDLVNLQAISRSVMRDYPSTVETNSERKEREDRNNFRSPSINVHFKKQQQQYRPRSVSPMPARNSRQQAPKQHVSRQHNRDNHRQPSPAQSVQNQHKGDYYVRKHAQSAHARPSSSSRHNPPHSSKNHNKTPKKSSSSAQRQHVSPTSPRSNTSKHTQHTQLDTTPVSPESLSFSLRKARGETQGARKLSLSPVSQAGLTQYTTTTKPKQHNSTTHMGDEDMFSQMSQSPLPTPTGNHNINTIIVTTHTTPKKLQTNTKVATHTTPKDMAIPSNIPNVFNCQKEISLIRGEKDKNTVGRTQVDEPILDNIPSQDLISNEDLESISSEFDLSWNELSQSIPKKQSNPTNNKKQHKNNTQKHNYTTDLDSLPFITEENVIKAIENPITNMKDYNANKEKRLQRAQNLKRKAKNQFDSDFNMLRNSKNTNSKNPVVSKRRTPRKSSKPVVSYFEG